MIRPGMWVVHAEHGVGIATRIGPAAGNAPRGVVELGVGDAEFHRTNDKGETIAILTVAAGDLAQARYREIPEVRRTLTREQFAARGYE